MLSNKNIKEAMVVKLCDQLPEYPDFDPKYRRAPKREVNLSQDQIKLALKNALRVYQESDANAVKIEGGADKAEIVRYLTSNGIAVCGHIGLLPQAVRGEGGYKIKGKSEQEQMQLLEDARAIEEAGAFCIVIEGVKSKIAYEVAQSVSIPVIGIGAGLHVDGQVLVFSDMLGLYEPFTPKFVKKYLDGASLVKGAVAEYADEVRNKKFPQEIHTYE